MSDTADSILPETGTPVIERDLSFLTMSDTTGVPRSPSGLRGTLAQGGRRRSAPTTPRRTPAADRFIPSSANVQAFRMGSPAHKLTPEEKHRRNSSARNQHGRTDSPERIAVYNPGSGRTIGLAGGSGSHGGSYANQRTISGGGVGVFGMGTGGVSNARARAAEEPRMSSGAREINGNIFAKKEGMEAAKRRLENMLSAALEVDRSKKVFEFKNKASELGKGSGAMWDDPFLSPNRSQNGVSIPKKKDLTRHVPTTPFRVLDAPGLRDDYYCSLIAYSETTHSLAVGLHSDVYSWNEATGARPFEGWSSSHVTCLAFSSADGRNNILAIGRIDGNLTLWKPGETTPRLEQTHDAGIACVSWKPIVTPKTTLQLLGSSVPYGFIEELLVGDEMGNIYIYAVDWNDPPGENTSTLLRRLPIHTQQICGLAWSMDGSQFITGGNDNMACLFDTDVVLGRKGGNEVEARVGDSGERYRWPHGAAVKAIAFCPWQRSLVATGGGSNDRGIHFYHTFSGQMLATINVAAQVTSLIWSTSRREIAATFGFSNPDHPIRIAVFAWPECVQVVSIPWQEDMRALYAVHYPGGPAVSEGSGSAATGEYDSEDEEREIEELLNRVNSGDNGAWEEMRNRRRKPAKKKKRGTEGCIIVAASDETVRFHEVWSENPRGVLGWKGVLGGSDILEELEGIENEGSDVIR